MATDPAARLALYDELLRRFASGTRAAQLYAADHPLLGRNVEGLLAALKALQQQQPSVTVGIVDNEFVVADTPLPKASSGDEGSDRSAAREQDRADLVRARRHGGGDRRPHARRRQALEPRPADRSRPGTSRTSGSAASRRRSPAATASRATWPPSGSSTRAPCRRRKRRGKAPRPRASPTSRRRCTPSKGSPTRSRRTGRRSSR